MFLKRCSRSKSGKRHEYWQLVESYRTPQGCRHRVVAYLGELSRSERLGWGRLGRLLDGKAASKASQLALYEPRHFDDDVVPDHIEVRLKGVHVQQTRDFGNVYLGLMLWRMLGLHDLLQQIIPAGEEDVPWALSACVLTLARFVEPSSELHAANTWFARTALPEMLGIAPAQMNESRLYRTLDAVLPHKTAIEQHLKARFGELFSLDYDLLLYDVTSTYFEGVAQSNSLAARGHSRDHRPDCKQVCIALVATREGYPFGSEVFAGNRSDATTVQEIVETMESRHGRASRIWVMDRGMVSEANLTFLRQRGARYLVGTPKSLLRRFQQHLVAHDWHEVYEGLEVKLIASPEGPETYVLCRSRDRREKEKAIHQRFVERIDAALTRMSESLAKARSTRDRGDLERRIGRLLQKNSRAAAAFGIQVVEAPEHRSGLKLIWTRQPQWEQRAALCEGCYLLRTNVTGQTPQELWQMYIQLTEVEDAFRTAKGELHLRPIWRHLEDRVRAHVLFSFLAYALWKTLQTWMERAGLGRGTRTVLEELDRIKASDVILPTTQGRRIRLCCVTRPEAAQRALIERLGLALPERLGRPTWVPGPETLTL